ncbi:MAG: S53 family peptidase, partial [Marmoricola sp.]
MTDSAEPTPSPATVQATVVLRRRGSDSPPVGLRRRITAAELGEKYGAHPDDVAAVRRLLADRGAEVLEEHGSSRRLRVQGTADALAGLEDDDRVAAVLGLDEGPLARPRAIIADPTATKVSYTPLQLADAYGMPDGDGTGQTIAIVELGGGFAQDDLDHYFSGLGLKSPTVRAVGVDGAKNQPGKDPQGADVEVLLDIEVVGAIAPRAEIVVYFAPNSDAGFVDAISTAAEADPTPAAISISWGQSEDGWTAQARTALDSVFADAVTLGVTVTVAAGDNGSADGSADGAKHADFPASSPHVLACGGTSLQAADLAIRGEVAWNDGATGGAGGGGVSSIFAVPAWQIGLSVAKDGQTGPLLMRGVPDVCG